MKLSIVTINRNNASGLARTLESTLGAQPGFGDWEQIVVDGASTDGSMAALEPYRGDQHLGWTVSEPDEGIFNAMNKGAAHARGDYLLFLNAGDALLPGVLANVFANPVVEDLVYGDLFHVFPDGNRRIKQFPPSDRLHDWLFLTGSLPHQGTFIARRLHEELGGYDESFRSAGDSKFFFQAVAERHATARHLGFPVSEMDATGISLQPETLPARLDERRRFLTPYFGENLYHCVVFGILPRHLRLRHDIAATVDPDVARQLRYTVDGFFWLRRRWLGRRLVGAFSALVSIPERIAAARARRRTRREDSPVAPR